MEKSFGSHNFQFDRMGQTWGLYTETLQICNYVPNWSTGLFKEKNSLNT